MHVLPEVLSCFWFIPGCEACEFTLYTKLRHTCSALIINHKTLLFNRSPDHCILACHTGNSNHATDGYQSHRMNSNVRHTVHLQVRSGSERNRRHNIPRKPIDLHLRLHDHHSLSIFRDASQSGHQLPNKRGEDLRSSTTVFIFDFLPSIQLFRMG